MDSYDRPIVLLDLLLAEGLLRHKRDVEIFLYAQSSTVLLCRLHQNTYNDIAQWALCTRSSVFGFALMSLKVTNMLLKALPSFRTGGPALAGEVVLRVPYLSRRATGGVFEFGPKILILENCKLNSLFSILQEEPDTQADSSSGRT